MAIEPAPTGNPRRDWIERYRIRALGGLLVLAAIVGGLFAFDQFAGDGDSDAELGALDGVRPEVGAPAPEFALRDPSGEVRNLSEYEGQVVWVNFWATWCGPCRRELPDIQQLSDEFGDDGLVVLAVNQRQSGDAASDFWEELDLDLPILLDEAGEVSEQYRLLGLPNNFFIDREGRVSAIHFGFLTEEQMRESLSELGLGGELLDLE